jgi:hypothetical protein
MIKAIIKNVVTGEVTEIEGTPEPIVPSIEQIQSQKLNELRQVVAQVRAAGMPFSFDSVEYHMQTEAEDIANWTSALVRLYRMPDTTVTYWIRTQEKVTIFPTVAKCIELMEQAQDYYYTTIIGRGNIENVINNETDKSTLEAYNVQTAFQTALTAILS